MPQSYDILIVGAGLVGSSLAKALSFLPLSIGIIDTKIAFNATTESDGSRAIALSYGSRRILQDMGLWQNIAKHATEIKKIHVSDRSHFAKVRITASKENVPALGYTIDSQILNCLLNTSLTQYSHLHLIYPAKVRAIQQNSQGWLVTLLRNGAEETVQTKLLIAADGTQSTVRDLLHIDANEVDYGQSAIVANITVACFHQHIAYERFTQYGPIAMLPLPGNVCALVWSVANTQAADIMALPNQVFLQRLQLAFGYRLGRLTGVSKRYCYPLKMLTAKQQLANHAIVIGNAAHSLHPIAAQGLNLGLRDVEALVQAIDQALQAGKDFAAEAVLKSYVSQRQADQTRTLAFTNGLVRTFSNDFFALGLLRNISMLAIENLPALKSMLSKQAMGMRKRGVFFEGNY